MAERTLKKVNGRVTEIFSLKLQIAKRVLKRVRRDTLENFKTKLKKIK